MRNIDKAIKDKIIKSVTTIKEESIRKTEDDMDTYNNYISETIPKIKVGLSNHETVPYAIKDGENLQLRLTNTLGRNDPDAPSSKQEHQQKQNYHMQECQPEVNPQAQRPQQEES